MDKGQHLRLIFTPSDHNFFVALATDLTLHLSASTENSTTKDSSDSDGNWNEYDVTQRSGDIQFAGLIAVGTDDAAGESYLLDDIDVSDTVMSWKLAFVSGDNNRTIGKTLCSGSGKITSLTMEGTNRQKATYRGQMNIYGAVAVGSD